MKGSSIAQNRVTNDGTSLLIAPGGHHRTVAVGQHSLVSTSQSEAYCDICQKELCNKYYLATHRRLKHSPPLTKGTLHTIMISQDSMPQNVDLNTLFNLGNGDHNKALQNLYMNTQTIGNGSPSPSSQPSSGAASTVGAGINTENATDSSAKTPPATSGDLNMQNIFANLMQQQNVSQMLEQMQAMNGMNMFNPLAALQGGGLLGMGGSPTKMKPREPMKTGGQNPLNFAFPFNLAPSTSTASQQSVIVSHNGDGEITPPQKRSKFESEGDENSKAVEHLINSLTSGSSICNECGKDCENPLALITHKAQEHEADKQAIISPTFSCNECDKQFKGPHFLEQHKMTTHNPASRLLMGVPVPTGFPFGLPINLNQQFGIPDFDPASAMAQALSTPKGPANMKRQYSSNGKNYCDLCNKEVCNKYFLRTHMLKMHGIVIDENKTVIGNIDTLEKERQGALSFRCDICMTEMKTRQLLRQHKQEKHGVMPVASQPRIQTQKPSLPPGLAAMINPSMMLSGEEIKCPMCEKVLPASQLPIHVQNDHRQEASQLFGGPVPSSPSFECKFCPHVSKDADEHQGHQLSIHTAEFLQQQITKEAQKLDPSILRCNQCQYSTKDQKNLEMHVERHERMNEARNVLGQDLDEDEALQMTTEVALQMAVANKFGEQVFKCGVCNFSSADEQILEAHTNMAHGLNLTVTKKEVETEKILERNSHTSGSLSPSSESLPEGFIKAAQDKNHVMQNFVLRISDPQGLFVGELVAQLPVKSLVANPSKLIVEAIPQ